MHPLCLILLCYHAGQQITVVLCCRRTLNTTELEEEQSQFFIASEKVAAVTQELNYNGNNNGVSSKALDITSWVYLEMISITEKGFSFVIISYQYPFYFRCISSRLTNDIQVGL